jgi:hypothetical protein
MLGFFALAIEASTAVLRTVANCGLGLARLGWFGKPQAFRGLLW